VNAIFFRVLEALNIVISEVTFMKFSKPDIFVLNPKSVDNGAKITLMEEYDIEDMPPRIKITSLGTLAKGILQSRRKIADNLTSEQYEAHVVQALQSGIRSFHDALAISPSNPEALLAYGSFYDNFDESKMFHNYLQLALDGNPSCASVITRYGKHKEFVAKKDVPSFRETPQIIYGKAVETDPGCEEAIKGLLELLLNDIRRDKCDLSLLHPIFETIRNRNVIMPRIRNGLLVEDKTPLWKAPLWNTYKTRYETVWNQLSTRMPSEKRSTYLKNTKAAIIGPNPDEEWNCTIQ